LGWRSIYTGTPHHHDEIEMVSLDSVLPEHFADYPFDAVAVRCMRQRSLARHDAKPGIIVSVADKKHLKVPVRQTFGMQGAIKSVFAQQPVRSGKSSRRTRRRVLHDPWRGVH
jgi:hypothetical protein